MSYMLLPDSTTHALVTKIDALPRPLNRALISLLESPEAGRTEIFAELLGRRTFADSGKSMFRVLHETHNLQSVPIDEIVMTPRANVQIPLREVLNALGYLRDVKVEAQREAVQTQGFNPHLHNQQAQVAAENVGIAKNLIIEAEMMEADARSKRARAYALAPELDPSLHVVKTEIPVEPATPTEPAVESVAEGVSDPASESTDQSGDATD